MSAPLAFKIEDWDGMLATLPSITDLGVPLEIVEAAEDLLSAFEGPAIPRFQIEWLVTVVVLLERRRADKLRGS